MKTAKELFEELGYELVTNTDTYIQFGIEVGFSFCIKEKEFAAFWGYECKNITMEEYKAINQMVKELGWNE